MNIHGYRNVAEQRTPPMETAHSVSIQKNLQKRGNMNRTCFEELPYFHGTHSSFSCSWHINPTNRESVSLTLVLANQYTIPKCRDDDRLVASLQDYRDILETDSDESI